MSRNLQKEFELWQKTQTIDNPIPNVWLKINDVWVKADGVSWKENKNYIVDNEYAKLRMDAIDSGSEIEYLQFDGKWYPINKSSYISFNFDIYKCMDNKLELRLKPKYEPTTKIVKEWLVKALNSNNWSVMSNTMADEEAKEFFSKKGHEYIPTGREWEVPNV